MRRLTFVASQPDKWVRLHILPSAAVTGCQGFENDSSCFLDVFAIGEEFFARLSLEVLDVGVEEQGNSAEDLKCRLTLRSDCIENNGESLGPPSEPAVHRVATLCLHWFVNPSHSSR